MKLLEDVQKLVDRLNRIENDFESYGEGIAVAMRLKRELFELGYVVQHNYASDGDGGTYTAINIKDL